jgi:serine/threonine protein kinase
MSNSEIQASSMELPEGVREGAIISDKYLIGPVLGAGAMGIVVAARHLLLNEDVAIKFLVAGRWDQADAVQRFVREAQAAIRIQSEHVVRVHDVAVLESGAPYIVMEHLKGRDLAKRLRAEGPLPVAQAVDLVLQACEAISESHRIGIVHRDLKPANLFVLEREGAPASIKVLDFGISKSTRLVPRTVDGDGTLESAQITQARAILGSPFYMSPEQMESARDVDSRTDIWALGVTLFEMIVGRPPFTGHSLVQVYSKMASPDESGWRVALGRHPADLAAIIGKCLEWERERRYATVRDFARALAPLGTNRSGVSLRRIEVSPDPSESNPGVEKAPPLTATRRRGRLQLGRNLVAATLAGFFGSAVFVLASRSRPASDAPSPAVAPARVAVSAPSVGSATPWEDTLPAQPPALAEATATPQEPSLPNTTLRGPSSPRTLHVAVKAMTAASASVGPSAPVAASAPPSSTSPGSAAPAPSSFIPESLRGLLEKRE